MLSCFPFSYSPLKDDDYNHLFIGQEEITAEAKDNCLNISVSSIDSSGQPLIASTEKLKNSPVLERSFCQTSGLHSSPLSSLPTRDNIHLPVPLPRTFRKPDAGAVESCLRTESSPVSHTTTFGSSLTSSAKSSLLKLGFHRSKGTEHLQQEALRKSNEAHNGSAHCQRYIKLPTSSSISRNSRLSDSVHNKRNTSHHLVTTSPVIKSSESRCHSLKTTRDRPSSGCLPKPPSDCIKLNLNSHSTTSPAPSSSSLRSSNKTSVELSPKPPPRPQTSHPGLSSGTISSVMPRQKVQFTSVNTSDTLSSAANDQNSSLTPTRETSLTANSSNTGCASSLARNNCQPASTSADWNRSGAFINKPARGWLHSDHQIADSGISYAVRYVGCLGINTSMKTLDFDTRSQIAKECINRVCESGGLKTPDKKRRPEKRINRMLAETPNMESAGADVNLVITSSFLHLTVIETGEVIAKHEMPNISFASGGDADTLDFVAYVAKDQRYGRACFVLECGGGLAQDVITTIGQAFELRFKEFLKRSPKSNPSSEQRKVETVLNGSTNAANNSNNNSSARLDDREYYNDLPGKIPPDVPLADASDNKTSKESSADKQPTAAPRSYKKSVSNSEQNGANLIDLSVDISHDQTSCDTSEPQAECDQSVGSEHHYVNCSADDSKNKNDSPPESTPHGTHTIRDPFDMQPFTNALASVTPEAGHKPNAKLSIDSQLEKEEWFHGPISRKQSEELVVNDGDFLVRESQGSSGQYVLTGMQSAIRKHLLLVDPEGVVRTKDKTFESVSHLINYHRNNGLPIISAESALVLRNAVIARH